MIRSLLIFLILLILFSCDKETLLFPYSPDNGQLNQLQAYQFRGFLNDSIFATNDILFRIVEDELHIHLTTNERVFPLQFNPPSPIDCQTKEVFYIRISNFKGIGTYVLDNVKNNVDTNSIFQWEVCIKDTHWINSSTASYLLEDRSDFFQIEIETLDLDKGIIQGNMLTQLITQIPGEENVTPEVKLRARFNAPVQLFPNSLKSDQFPDDCTTCGIFLNQDLPLRQPLIRLCKDGSLTFYIRGTFPIIYPAHNYSDCTLGNLFIELNNFSGPGLYRLHSHTYPNYFILRHCFQQDSFLRYYYIFRVTDYFLLQIETFDEVNQKISGHMYADLSHSGSQLPEPFFLHFNTEFKIE